MNQTNNTQAGSAEEDVYLLNHHSPTITNEDIAAVLENCGIFQVNSNNAINAINEINDSNVSNYPINELMNHIMQVHLFI